MKPSDVLPGATDSVEKDGVVIRKGTIGAFTENIKIIEDTKSSRQKCQEATDDLLLLVPALMKLRFFDFYSIKSDKVRKFLRQKYPDLPI